MATIRKRKTVDVGKVPVTLLGGFLGAGKSTLLRHILEEKREKDEGFKCAVIVNDVAELNIDSALIESTGLIQSEGVISMQNGCVCCTLSSDLSDQIVKLVGSKSKGENKLNFNYIIIEASGVSEPAAIAALFDECHENHDHALAHQNEALADLAEIDTLVTVVDSGEFYQNLGMISDPSKSNYPRLLVDQVEYSNVVLLNKTDLVDKQQLDQIKSQVAVLNPNAKIVPCHNSKVDVKDVVHTGFFKPEKFNFDSFLAQFQERAEPISCCKKAIAKGESPCCLKARTVDSGKSQVLLPSSKVKSNPARKAHAEIASFVYKARRPFQPKKFYDDFLTKFFVVAEDDCDEDSEDENEDEEMEVEKEKQEPDKADIRKMQEEGAAKKIARTEAMGYLLRMKGFMWQASSHDIVGFVSTAGNFAKVDSPGIWNCLKPEAWDECSKEYEALRKDWVEPWGDRRQELVLIGHGLEHDAIQSILDECLLSDNEMAMGVDGWKAVFGDVYLNNE